MQIPKKFTINGQTVTVEVVDRLPSNNYGEYSDATEKVSIAKTIEENGRTIKLSHLQLENTFWHEVFHVFQFHGKGEFSESESSTYAGMMVELIHSSDLKINPNEVVNDKPIVHDYEVN